MRIKSINNQKLEDIFITENVFNDILNSLYPFVSSFDIAKRTIRKAESKTNSEIIISFHDETIKIRNGKGSGASRLKKIAKSMQSEIFSESTGKDLQLPIIARYDKILSEEPHKETPFSSSRTYGYRNCFSPSFIDFTTWYERLFRIYYDNIFENKDPKDLVLIRIVQEAINAVTVWKDITFSVSKNTLILHDNDNEMNITDLDAETRRIIFIIGDIIRRCTILNPFPDSIKKTSGIIMIEQISEAIKTTLKTIFSNIQFIYGE